MNGYFIAGTDTGVGKTFVTVKLMQALQQAGQSVIGMKPVASGCERVNDSLRNEDALRLQAQASVELAYDAVNPYAFEPAIAPHIAARQAGVEIDAEKIKQQAEQLATQCDCLLVEGVGGWLVPLSPAQTMADLARELGMPVILVVGIRLGCINHALLSLQAIRDSGCELAGWVANLVDPAMACVDENISIIRESFAGKPLAVIENGGNVPPTALKMLKA